MTCIALFWVKNSLSLHKLHRTLNFRKNKNDRRKREGLYQDRDKGDIRMIGVQTMIKALWLAWIPRLFAPGKKNWKTIPDYYLGRYGGLSFF